MSMLSLIHIMKTKLSNNPDPKDTNKISAKIDLNTKNNLEKLKKEPI